MLPPYRTGRRSFLGLGMAGGLSMLSGPGGALAADAVGKAKNVLVILEQGGMSHTDTWDPKPLTPADQASPYRPISTKVPGLQFTELLARTATVADQRIILKQ